MNENCRDKICIVWDIHYTCNYHCPYCWFEGTLTRVYSKERYIPIEDWISRWNYLYERYGSLHIEITGGEPFIYPNFMSIIKSISSKHTIRITTNLSVDIEKSLAAIDSEQVKVICSFHPSCVQLEAFLKKILFLKKENYGDTVIYVAYPPQFNRINYYRKIFEENGINFSVTPFCGMYKGAIYPSAYNNEEKRILRQYLPEEDRVKYTLNNESPRGKLCRAGQRFALLFEDGKIARCGQLKNSQFANLFNEDFEFLNSPMPCESDFCPCDGHKFIVP